MASLKKNVISLFILQGSNYVIPLLTLPYLTRTLGIEGFGVFGLALAIAQYLVLFTDFGFNLSVTKKIAENQKNRKYISKLFWEAIFAKTMLCTLSLLIIFIFVYFSFSEIVKKEQIYTSLMIVGTVLMPIWFFQGIEDLSKITTFSVISKFISLPLFFVFVSSEKDVDIAILIHSSVTFMSGVIAFYFIYKNRMIDWVRPTWNGVSTTIKDGSSVFLATLTISLYTGSTAIILSFTNVIEEVSLFAAADRLKGAALGVFVILGNAFYPRINSLLVEDEYKAYALIKRILIIQTPICLIFVLIMFYFSTEISILMYGTQFYEVADVLKILSPVILIILTCTVLANYLLLPLGYNREYVTLPMITVAVHIPLCYYLSNHYGAIGGALSMLFVEIISLSSLLFITYKKGLLAKIC
ncbi:flippase [Vibrio cholerae]|nr:flippase [Vibrio cholerae]EJB8378450.1 flippase [Vibrio cholerae]